MWPMCNQTLHRVHTSLSPSPSAAPSAEQNNFAEITSDFCHSVCGFGDFDGRAKWVPWAPQKCVAVSDGWHQKLNEESCAWFWQVALVLIPGFDTDCIRADGCRAQGNHYPGQLLYSSAEKVIKDLLKLCIVLPVSSCQTQAAGRHLPFWLSKE